MCEENLKGRDFNGKKFLRDQNVFYENIFYEISRGRKSWRRIYHEKKVPARNVMFHGEMHDNIIMRKDKKNCAAASSFWPEARFWDFFGLKKAEGLLKAK